MYMYFLSIYCLKLLLITAACCLPLKIYTVGQTYGQYSKESLDVGYLDFLHHKLDEVLASIVKIIKRIITQKNNLT